MTLAERTNLTPDEETAFQSWAQQNGIENFDHPDAHYDMRGFWKATAGAPHPPGSQMHFPDTFKQHGHPTFSVESQYSAGPFDGGRWNGDSFVPPGADFMTRTGGTPRVDPTLLREALLARLRGGQ